MSAVDLSLYLLRCDVIARIIGDANRPEMLKHFNVGKAKVCIVTFDEIAMINKAVVKLRKSYPDLPIVVRAKNDKHRQRLESMFGKIILF